MFLVEDDTYRFANASSQPLPETHCDGDILQLRPVDEVDAVEPQYQTVLDGREELHARESDVDSEYISASSVEEEMTVDGNYRDSDSEDTDAYFTPPSSLNHQMLGLHPSKVFDKEGSVLNGTKTEVEERWKVNDKFDDDDDEMVELMECEEESQAVACETDGSSSKITPKTGN